MNNIELGNILVESNGTIMSAALYLAHEYHYEDTSYREFESNRTIY